MYRPVDITQGKPWGQFVDVSYVRSDDQTTWRFRCRYLGNEVQWASIRDDGSQGRWRDQYDVEEKITFSEDAKGEILSILMTNADGSVLKKEFGLSLLR